jgi:hypothetical protein
MERRVSQNWDEQSVMVVDSLLGTRRENPEKVVETTIQRYTF